MPSGRRSARERPEAFGAFTVSADLGVSPSGSAYLALDPATNARVLLLTIDPVKGRRKDDAVANALHAWCAAAISHPGIPRPLTAGIEAGIAYVVYPYLPGQTLDDLVQQGGPQSLAEVVQLLAPVAALIDEVAAAGAHHGALTPADILVSGETVNVTRLGLVDTLTQAGVTFPVQPPYASPERVAGEPPTIAADVYSLAAIALMMIGGAAPELRPDRRAGASRQPPQLALPLSASEEEVLRTVVGVEAGLLRTVMSRALSDDPRQRPASASALVAGLRDALVQEHTTPEPAPIEVATTALPRTSYRNLALAAAAIAIIATMLSGGLLRERDDELAAPPGSSEAPASIPAPPAAVTITPPAALQSPPPSTTPQPVNPPAETQSAAPRTSTPSRPSTTTPRTTRTAPAATRADRQRGRQRSTAPTAPAVDPNAPGSLLVTSDPPGAQLFVNEEPVGTTPLLVSSVSVGTHRIRVELAGFQPFSSSVQIEPGKRSRVTATLTP